MYCIVGGIKSVICELVVFLLYIMSLTIVAGQGVVSSIELSLLKLFVYVS